MKFIIAPIRAVSLMVNSKSEVISGITTAATGPYINDATTRIASFASKVRNETGILKTNVAPKASAAKTAIPTIVLVFNFVLFIFFLSHPDFTVGQGISPYREHLLFADYTAGMELHLFSKNMRVFLF